MEQHYPLVRCDVEVLVELFLHLYDLDWHLQDLGSIGYNVVEGAIVEVLDADPGVGLDLWFCYIELILLLVHHDQLDILVINIANVLACVSSLLLLFF